MEKYLPFLLLLLAAPARAQVAERLSPEQVSYIDPELNNPWGLLTYQGEGGTIWVAELDRMTGLFQTPFGADDQVGEGAAPLLETFNGPEFGYDQQGWSVVYTKKVNGINQIWAVRKENGTYISQQITDGVLPRQSVLASKNRQAAATCVVYSIGGFEGVMAWTDLSDPAQEVVIDSVDRGIRWVDNSNSLVYIKQSGPHKGEIAVYDTDTQTETVISGDGRQKSNPYGWLAPEYGDQLQVACLIDNDRKIAIYGQDASNAWQIIRELPVPEEAAYDYFGSPEAFVAAGKSFISCVVKAEPRAYSPAEVWILGLAEAPAPNLQLRIDDDQGTIIRTDPETFVGDHEVFVYYNVIEADNTFAVYRARTGIETLNRPGLSHHIIPPRVTDEAIDGNQEPHYALYEEAGEQRNRLLLYFPGTTARPYDYLKFSKTAAEMGYHVISLSYENRQAVNYQACGGSTDVTCHGRARTEIWFGEDTHEVLAVSPSNSIMNRLTKLLQYLGATHPEKNWQQYIAGDTIHWRDIVVAGHSQGGGHAGFAGRQFAVDRVIMFAASDWVAGQTAAWIRTPGPTPADRFYGFIHEQDLPAASIILPTWQDYGILDFGQAVLVDDNSPPYNDSHGLLTNVPVPGDIRPHNYIIVDFATPGAPDYQSYFYTPVWRYLLGQESTTNTVAAPPPSRELLPVFPNPVQSILQVPAIEAYQIVDLTGRIWQESSMPATQIDVSTLPPGIYLLRTKKQVGKFVKY